MENVIETVEHCAKEILEDKPELELELEDLLDELFND